VRPGGLLPTGVPGSSAYIFLSQPRASYGCGGARSLDKQVRTVLELRAGMLSESDVFLERVTGVEAVSTLYAFDVAFRGAGEDLFELQDLVGKASWIRLRRPDGEERYFHGLLTSVSLSGVSGGKPNYNARLVPAFALLEQTQDSRIFQGKAVPDIAKEVLDANHIRFRLALSSSYLKREFCVQYRESDLAFISRLLEEEGIFYFFEHTEDHHTLVLADAVSACPSISGDKTLPFRDERVAEDTTHAEHLMVLERIHRQRSGKSSLRDFDFSRPDLDLTASAAASEDTEREVYEYPAGFSGPVVGKRLATVRLDALRHGMQAFSGQSSCIRLAAGSTFDVAEHPDGAFNKSLLLIRVEHEGLQELRSGSGTAVESSYRNRFASVPAAAPYRPARKTPRPRMIGTQTAIVVGPDREEVYPDAHGRIKIQFHWDRQARNDENASCFVRHAQAWAGAGFGQVILPRVGQEVVVRFLEGNPDRPLVVGAVFNGANEPPLELPAERTQAVFRTESSIGGGGFNELRFEDAKATERFFRHAQKDEQVTVLNDRTARVGGDQVLVIEKDRTLQIDGDQTLRIGADDESSILGNQDITVGKDRRLMVGAQATLAVARMRSVSVGGRSGLVVQDDTKVSVAGISSVAVGGVHTLNVAGANELVVDGNLSRLVGASCTERVGADVDEAVAKDATSKVEGDFAEQVEGEVTMTAGNDIEESSGGSAEIGIEGPLGLIAKSIEIQADTLSIVVNGTIAWQMTSTGVTVAGKSVTVDASSDIQMKGGNIKKDASDAASQENLKLKALDDLRKSRASVKLSVKGSGGAPLANIRYRAELPDGSVHEGATDGSGGATIPATKEGNVKLSFPELDAGTWKTE
jgi:type VI secretion system secreted protein VgrG